MVLAGLAANGTTEIENIEYIDRGYDNIVEKLSAVGADITRKKFFDPDARLSAV
jgi:UDP-N-acetylglucosamine 1-carboxyvinyltransferase